MKLFRKVLNFFKFSYYNFKALYGWLRPSLYITMKVVAPFLQIAFFAYLMKYSIGNKMVAFTVIGNSVVIISLSSVTGVGMMLAYDRRNQTLPYIFISPINRIKLTFSRIFVNIFDGLLSATIGFIFGIIFFGISLKGVNIALVYLILFLISFFLSGLGVIAGSLSLISRDINPVLNISYLLLLFFCGINFPISYLPKYLTFISYSLPLTYGVRAIRFVFIGYSFNYCFSDIIYLIITGSFFYIIGFFMYYKLEKQSKKTGAFIKI